MTATTANETTAPKNRKPEAARTGLGAIAKLVMMELRELAQDNPGVYIPVTALADLCETNVDAVERVCRELPTVDVRPGRDLPAEYQIRRPGDGTGFYPCVRLMGAAEAAAAETLRNRRMAAATRLYGLLETITDSKHDFEVDVSTDGNEVTIRFPQGDGLNALLRGTEGGV